MKEVLIKNFVKTLVKLERTLRKRPVYHLEGLFSEHSRLIIKEDVSSNGFKFDIEDIRIYDLVPRESLSDSIDNIAKEFYKKRPKRAVFFQDIDRVRETLKELSIGLGCSYAFLGVLEFEESNEVYSYFKSIEVSIVNSKKNHVMFEFKLNINEKYMKTLSSLFTEDINNQEKGLRRTPFSNPFKLSSWTLYEQSKSITKSIMINSEIAMLKTKAFSYLRTIFNLLFTSVDFYIPALIRVDTNITPGAKGVNDFFRSLEIEKELAIYFSGNTKCLTYGSKSHNFRLTNRDSLDFKESFKIEHQHPDCESYLQYIYSIALLDYVNNASNRVKVFSDKLFQRKIDSSESKFLGIERMHSQVIRLYHDICSESSYEKVELELDVRSDLSTIKRFKWIAGSKNEMISNLLDTIDQEKKAITTSINLKQSIISRKLNTRILWLTIASVLLAIITVLNSLTTENNTTYLDVIASEVRNFMSNLMFYIKTIFHIM